MMEPFDHLADLGPLDWTLLTIAPFVGSFLGVVITRLPEGRPVIWGRSACKACGGTLAARDLVPLLSWLLLRGRCRRCGHALGWFYPAVGLAAFAVAAIAGAVNGAIQGWLDFPFGWWLLAPGWIDLRRFLQPDALTLPLLVVGLVTAAVTDPGHLADHAAAALLGYLVMRIIAELYMRLRGREGLGQGDAKLLAAAGA